MSPVNVQQQDTKEENVENLLDSAVLDVLTKRAHLEAIQSNADNERAIFKAEKETKNTCSNHLVIEQEGHVTTTSVPLETPHIQDEQEYAEEQELDEQLQPPRIHRYPSRNEQQPGAHRVLGPGSTPATGPPGVVPPSTLSCIFLRDSGRFARGIIDPARNYGNSRRFRLVRHRTVVLKRTRESTYVGFYDGFSTVVGFRHFSGKSPERTSRATQFRPARNSPEFRPEYATKRLQSNWQDLR